MAILELLAGASQPLFVVDIAATLRRSRAEIYRMLVVLESLEYIQRLENGRYDLTARLFDLASRHAPKRGVISAARAEMALLSEKTLQSCHLMVNSGEHMVCVAREESPAAIGFSVQVGFRPPVLQSTSGRVFVAFQDEARQTLLLRRLRSSSRDAKLLREFSAGVAAARRQGHAVEPSRLTAGIHDLCAPILAPESDHAVACLTIPFVSHRLFKVTRARAIAQLLGAAHRITANLRTGGRPSNY